MQLSAISVQVYSLVTVLFEVLLVALVMQDNLGVTACQPISILDLWQ